MNFVEQNGEKLSRFYNFIGQLLVGRTVPEHTEMPVERSHRHLPETPYKSRLRVLTGLKLMLCLQAKIGR
jgi:hypothetical protein